MSDRLRPSARLCRLAPCLIRFKLPGVNYISRFLWILHLAFSKIPLPGFGGRATNAKVRSLADHFLGSPTKPLPSSNNASSCVSSLLRVMYQSIPAASITWAEQGGLNLFVILSPSLPYITPLMLFKRPCHLQRSTRSRTQKHIRFIFLPSILQSILTTKM